MIRNIGFILLAILLILQGLAVLLPLGLPAVIMAVLAIASGIFILLGK